MHVRDVSIFALAVDCMSQFRALSGLRDETHLVSYLHVNSLYVCSILSTLIIAVDHELEKYFLVTMLALSAV